MSSLLAVGQLPAYGEQTTPSWRDERSPQLELSQAEIAQAVVKVEPATVEAPAPRTFNSRLYRLGAGDVLGMEIFNLADYSRDYQVAADGYLTLPLVGSIAVQGMTLEELQLEAASRYRRYIRQPIITFEMKEARPIHLVIAGEVNRPGTYTISMGPAIDPSTPSQPSGMAPPTLTQLIQTAEGITQSADIRQIEIVRNIPAASATESVIYVSLWDLIATGDIRADVVLQDGDSVRIPTATAIDPAEATTLATASFSPDEMTVYVVGEVDTPGLVKVPPNTPLNQALLAAGGFNSRAQKGSVELVRLNPNGTVNQRDIDINLAADISEGSNPLLQENDTIVVKRSGASTFADTASNFVSPLNLLVNLFRALGGN